ncbi:multicopper oxidase family protein [Variovorax sp. OV329]|uniref:multicopper oxidase family protein n=1 Tax=Variovorax sp. OV329 TaxID=1882825 RepID=UPI001587C43E|nr:multicopper oxidase family protein [Variovorax sp. OV329]
MGAFLAACGGGSGTSAPPAAVETFRNPPELSSSKGELRARLDVVTTEVQVDGTPVITTIYNGQYIPPVLRLKPGDTLFLDLVNRSANPTNEHYHGLDVSPRINADGSASDNVFVHVPPGTAQSYEVAIPSSHHAGLYWYHSHQHGSSEQQVMGGLSGGLIIEGLLDPLPQLAGIRERVLLLKDIQIGDDGRVPADIDPSGPTHRTVNGQTNPVMTIAPGETQLLRIGNISANMYYRLKLPGHTFFEIARDGIRRAQVVAYDELLLPPASRSEVLIQGGPPGTYPLQTLDIDTGPQGDTVPATTLLTLVSQGLPVPARPIPGMPAAEDFRTLPVARNRTIQFIESADGNTFYIDSGNSNGPVQFDPARVDSIIDAGTVEEWTILNVTGEWHVFHIHQTNFQVTEINGVPQPFTGHQDNVNVSFQPDPSSPPGQVKLLIDFRNPNAVGKFVYHCHILEHEDGGMMAVAEMQLPGALASARPLQTPRAAFANAKFLANSTEARLATLRTQDICTTPAAGGGRGALRARGPAGDALAPVAGQGLALARSPSRLQALRVAGMLPASAGASELATRR